jgi:DNA-binding NarL/FixJ family response regulator
MTQYQPVFATRQPIRIARVRQLLIDAGIAADPQVVYPEDLPRVLAGASDCVLILDALSLPQPATIASLRSDRPGARMVIWAERPTAELIAAMIEFGLDGLLSSEIPLEEAAHALWRICRGERLMRFDSRNPDARNPDARNSGAASSATNWPVAEVPSFDAQWMYDGADPQGREK